MGRSRRDRERRKLRGKIERGEARKRGKGNQSTAGGGGGPAPGLGPSSPLRGPRLGRRGAPGTHFSSLHCLHSLCFHLFPTHPWPKTGIWGAGCVCESVCLCVPVPVRARARRKGARQTAGLQISEIKFIHSGPAAGGGVGAGLRAGAWRARPPLQGWSGTRTPLACAPTRPPAPQPRARRGPTLLAPRRGGSRFPPAPRAPGGG